MHLDRVGHFTRITATVGERSERLVFDTGIGVNVVSTGLAKRHQMKPLCETFTGRRMSGQAVEAPLVELPPILLDGHALRDQVAAVLDLGPEDGDDGFSGILGLTAFQHMPVTIDHRAHTLQLGDRRDAKCTVPLELRRQGPSTEAFLELTLPGGRSITVELDTGSGSLILDVGFLSRGDVEVSGEVGTTQGTDETGHAWVRHNARLKGDIYLSAGRQTRQPGPRVQFQDIIHSGLIGADYLDRFRYTVDLQREALLLAPSGV